MASAASTGININTKTIVIISLTSLGYIALSCLLVGFKPEEVVLVLIFNVLFYASVITRKFILGFSIFIAYWIVFDYMKAIPNYSFATVHTQGLYEFEKSIFGINYKGHLLTPNEYWRVNGVHFLDIAAGVFYLCWIPVPLGFGAYLFFTKRRQFLHFAFSFLVVNLVGFVIYYTYPAAPPWYIQLHGFAFEPHTPGNIAGLAKFDAYFNTNLFKSIYAKGSNVFAAMPSLHSAYPIIVLYYGIKNRLGAVNLFFATVTTGIWFSAVYTSHHYVTDVIAGILCAITGINLFNWLSKTQKGRLFLDKYEALIK